MSRSLAEIAFSNIPDEKITNPRALCVIENVAYDLNTQKEISNYDKENLWKDVCKSRNEYLDMFPEEEHVDEDSLKRMHDSYKAILDIRDNDWVEGTEFSEGWVWWDWALSYIVLEIPLNCTYDSMYALLETMVERWNKYKCDEKVALGDFGISMKNHYYNHILPAYKKYSRNVYSYDEHLKKMSEVNSSFSEYFDCVDNCEFYKDMVHKAINITNPYVPSPPSEEETALGLDDIQMIYQFQFPVEQV